MFLSVLNPQGVLTSLDLDGLPVWQLRLEALPQEDKVLLAVGIRYIAGTKDGTAFLMVVGIPIRCQLGDLIPVTRTTMPFERDAAKDRLREATKVLYNANIPAKEVEEILPKVGAMADVWLNIRKALFGGQATSLAAPGPVASGELEGFRWAITRTRFEPWCVEEDKQAPPPPGEAKEDPPAPAGKKGGKKGHGPAPVE